MKLTVYTHTHYFNNKTKKKEKKGGKKLIFT
jgi:hypothetical protein